MVIDGGGPKGDVLTVAEIAGVMGGKRTAELIPLCHPLPLTDLVVEVTPERAAGVLRVRAEAATTAQTGVEMEALTAASVAALTVYDMVKGVERGVEIRSIRLVVEDRRQERRVGARRRRCPGHRPPAPLAETWRPRRGPHPDPARQTNMSDRVAPPPTAFVLTTSDRSASGERDDASRRAPGRTPRGARLRGRAIGRARRAAGHRGGPGRCRGSPSARAHHRRHRPDAARRDAAGDARGHRLRGARASPSRCAPRAVARRRWRP